MSFGSGAKAVWAQAGRTFPDPQPSVVDKYVFLLVRCATRPAAPAAHRVPLLFGVRRHPQHKHACGKPQVRLQPILVSVPLLEIRRIWSAPRRRALSPCVGCIIAQKIVQGRINIPIALSGNPIISAIKIIIRAIKKAYTNPNSQ